LERWFGEARSFVKAIRAAQSLEPTPPIRRGDLLTDLRAICSACAKGHVLGYVGPQRARDAFAETIGPIGTRVDQH
jgi:hypothetical protein